MTDVADIHDPAADSAAEVGSRSAAGDGSWGPPGGPSRPAPRRVAKVAASPRRAIVAALATGVVFDAAVRTPPGVAWMVYGSAVIVAVWTTVARRRAARVALIAAAAFLPWFAVRSSPWLLVPNALAFVALAVFAADISAGGPVRRSVGGLVRVLASTVDVAIESPGFIARTFAAGAGLHRVRRAVPWRGVARSAAIALPVVGLLALLLASGDELFASTFTPEGWMGLDHLALIIIGALLGLWFVAMGTGPSRAPEREPTRRLRVLDTAMVLGGVTALFAVYGGVQLNGLLQGRAYIEAKTGLTYAQYARSGFFQLMAAAAVSFAVLCVVRRTVQLAEQRRRTLQGLVCAVTVLTVMLVAGSIVRLRLYSDVFGLTHLRLYTVVSAAWLGFLVVCAGVAACRADRREWVAVVGSAAAALAIFSMNVVNPDRLVAEENIGRVGTSQARFDGSYLGGLSDDAVPWLLANIDRAPAADRDALLAELCGRTPADRNWWSWNAAAAAADDAQARRCDG